VDGVSSPHLSDELLFSFFNNRDPDPEVVIVGILFEQLEDVVEDEGSGSEGRLGWVEGPSGLWPCIGSGGPWQDE
jgi:hypothetical protein